MPSIPIEYYSGNGIFLTWDWSGTPGITQARISRGDYGRTGPFDEIDIVDYPDYYYIDPEGTLDSFYLVEELDSMQVVKYVHPLIWGEEMFLISGIYYEIGMFMELRSHRERLRFSKDRTVASATMRNWRLDPAPTLEISSGSALSRGGLEIIDRVDAITSTLVASATPDYSEGLIYDLDYSGKVYFTNEKGQPYAVKAYNDVFASYRFRALSNHEINSALSQALHAIVAQAGVNKITEVGAAPPYWDRAIICGATGYLLRHIALQLMVPELSIFHLSDTRPDADIRSEAREKADFINSKSKEYLEEFKEAKEALKTEKYPGVYIISTPEFQLPGGRTRFFRAMFKSN